MILTQFAGRPFSVYCDHCRWSGNVTVPRNYEPPRCSAIEQSCPHCGLCYLHPMPEPYVTDIVHGIGMPEDMRLLEDED